MAVLNGRDGVFKCGWFADGLTTVFGGGVGGVCWTLKTLDYGYYLMYIIWYLRWCPCTSQ